MACTRAALIVAVLLISSMPVVLAEAEAAPALAPDIATGNARRGFHVEVAVAAAPGAGRPGADVAEDGAARRPVRRRRRAGKGHGEGTGAWAFSAMLPRGFVPPSGSSACHNDMPATAVDAQFFMCGGAGSP